MIGGGFLGGGISIVPAGKALIYASLTTEDGANIPNAVFKATRTGSTVTANGTIDGRAELLVDAGHTYTVSVTPAGGSYLNNSQTVATASAKSYAVKFYLYPAKANDASTTASLNALNSSISAHAGRKDNPHAVTKAQVGLGAYPASPADIGISTATQNALNAKQNKLTFDNTPVSGSSNPVKSGGVYSALAGKQDNLTFDDAPVSGSSNPVKSGGVYSALAGKQDNLTFDDAPVSGSSNPVKSGGIYSALDGKVSKTGSEAIAGLKSFMDGISQKSTQDIGVAGYNYRYVNRLFDVNNVEMFGDIITKEADKRTIHKTTIANTDGNGIFNVVLDDILHEDGAYEEAITPSNGAPVFYRYLSHDGTGYSRTPYRPYSQATNNDVLTKGHVADILAPKQDKISLYEHTIRVWTTDAPNKFIFTLTVLNQSPTEFTLPTLRNYLGSLADDYKQCSGMARNSGSSNMLYLTGVRGGNITEFIVKGLDVVIGSILNLSIDWMEIEVRHADKVRQIV